MAIGINLVRRPFIKRWAGWTAAMVIVVTVGAFRRGVFIGVAALPPWRIGLIAVDVLGGSIVLALLVTSLQAFPGWLRDRRNGSDLRQS